jgi:hypothetical protein
MRAAVREIMVRPVDEMGHGADSEATWKRFEGNPEAILKE